jgi:hypothetical protein
MAMAAIIANLASVSICSKRRSLCQIKLSSITCVTRLWLPHFVDVGGKQKRLVKDIFS